MGDSKDKNYPAELQEPLANITPEPCPPLLEAERVLLAIKGPWRIFHYMLLNLTKVIQAWAMLGNVFLGTETSHHCRIPEGYNLSDSIPHHMNNGELVSDKCHVYKNFSYLLNETEPCPNGWQYDKEIHSIVDSWDLVCDRDHLPTMAQTVLVGGVLCGAFVTTIFADKYGRKAVLSFSMVAIAVLGCITAAVDNYYVFIVLRFLTGVFQQGVVLPCFVLTCELFPANSRALYAIIGSGVFWPLGMVLLSLTAYRIPHWRHLLLAISIPGFAGIPYYWILTESPSWLLAKQRYKEVQIVVKRSMKWNTNATEEEIEMVKKLLDDLENTKVKCNNIRKSENCKEASTNDAQILNKTTGAKSDKSSNYSFFDILKSKRLMMYCLINLYLWCTTTFVYYGLSFTSGSLTKNKYLGFVLSAIPDVPGAIASALATQYIGRRYPIFTFYTLSAIGILITLAVPRITASGTDLSLVIIIASMVGKFGISATFNCIFLWAPELYPTTVRNVGFGLASVGGRIGNICAPLSAYIAISYPLVIGALFGGMSLGAAGLCFILPETHQRTLPLTISEVEAWKRTVSKEEKEAFLRMKQQQRNKYKIYSKKNEQC